MTIDSMVGTKKMATWSRLRLQVAEFMVGCLRMCGYGVLIATFVTSGFGRFFATSISVRDFNNSFPTVFPGFQTFERKY